MTRFYKVAITKHPVGSAIRHKEPAVQGKVIVRVSDSTTAGDYKLLVMDCDEAQNKSNLAIPGVEELSEEQTVHLATRSQPQRICADINPRTI